MDSLSLHDPELDPPGRRDVRVGQAPHLPQEYQRLVANPFLALAALMAWSAAVWRSIVARNLPLLLLALPGIAVVVYCLQYHCLDCGATGHLFRWRSHACPRVLYRQQTDQVRRLRGPNPTFQTIVWAYLLTAIAVLLAAVLSVVRT